MAAAFTLPAPCVYLLMVNADLCEESGCQDPVTAGVLRVKPLSSLTVIPQCAVDNQGCLIQQFYQAV